ncbi:hypothetical protein [Pseudalkalibacillus berkeleyi]|uniref:Pore-forming protein n=1 Tax=Pseudalkalibacillus berkeleyi TaxID=1069813 RepID=A0ABS9GZ68_9BACL|nr:hypothetical protein [Pseudalkalibacillus berkeleyi]MCF6136690.1 hypothetical protein [Pseudalkalibacillus berkeleyi]
MIYKSGLPLFFVMFIYPLLMVGTKVFNLSFWTSAGIIILFFTILKIQCHIFNDSLMYEVLLWKVPIYRKRVSPAQIIEIVFKRTGWARRSAVVRVSKGLNIRLVEFEPAHICTDLESFAIQHKIRMEKTKDYQLLEKYY